MSKSLKGKLDAAKETTLAKRGSNVLSLFQEAQDPSDPFRRALIAATGTAEFAQRLVVVAWNEVRNNEMLADCTRASFMAALLHAAHLQLEVGGALGHFYLVPFKNTRLNVREVVPILGYRGIINLARRSQQLSSIAARAVYSADYFDWNYGLQDKLEHRPQLEGDRGKIIAFYGVARFTNGGVQPLVMSKAEVDKFRARAKASDKGPWDTDYEPMGAKTVIRRMEPFLPLTNQAATAIQQDEAFEADGRMPELLDLGDLLPPAKAEAKQFATSGVEPGTEKAPSNEAAKSAQEVREVQQPAATEPTEAEQREAPVVCAICGSTSLIHDDAKHAEWAAAERKRKAELNG